jgi:hypothetical protein
MIRRRLFRRWLSTLAILGVVAAPMLTTIHAAVMLDGVACAAAMGHAGGTEQPAGAPATPGHHTQCCDCCFTGPDGTALAPSGPAPMVPVALRELALPGSGSALVRRGVPPHLLPFSQAPPAIA